MRHNGLCLGWHVWLILAKPEGFSLKQRTHLVGHKCAQHGQWASKALKLAQVTQCGVVSDLYVVAPASLQASLAECL